MLPYFADDDKQMFYRYLDVASVYFEFGSGGSTYQANSRNNITKIYSVESDKRYINELKPRVSDKVTFFFNEMDARPDMWGYPGKNSTPEQWINYSNYILSLQYEEQQKIDFLLIDGRFRVACCLKSFAVIKPDCFVAFDDFLTRKEYHVVLDYYDLVEKTKDERMVILKKKSGVSVPESLVKQYELNAY